MENMVHPNLEMQSQQSAVPSLQASSPALSAPVAAVDHTSIQQKLAANSVRLVSCADRLVLYFKGALRLDATDYAQLCFSIARGMDFALGTGDIPRTAPCLPSIIKQVYLHRNDPSIRLAISMLMISTKNACKNGWFHDADAEELLRMANEELHNNFCMEASAATEAGNALDTISKIMPRYYPKMKFGRLIVSFEAKPGYDIMMADFHIDKNLPRQEKIMLFIVQTDNLETSSCIISPPHVSFLVNGKGVDKRTNVSQDTGPQFPTDIVKMIKFGTNIIQAVGYFSGNYLIAIASVGKVTSSSGLVLKDYVQPNTSALSLDSDLIEGPSRITLNCPISFKLIKTPVKGHLCKHHQCFDYENFMMMNLKKPSWRCPCCNQPTSYVDLRIDQNMVKILGAAGEGVGDVVILRDGSWKKVSEDTERQDGDMKSSRSTSTPMDIVDLTMEQDVTSSIINLGTEDRKPFQGIQGFPSLEFSQPTFSHQHASHVWESVENIQLQEAVLETERPPIPRYVNRAPVAIQALPVQAQTPGPSRWTITNVPNPSTMNPNRSSSTAHQAIRSDEFSGVSCDVEMLDVPRTSEISGTQNQDHQDQRHILNPPTVQQVIGLPAPNLISSRVPLDAYRAWQSTPDHPTLRMHPTMSQPANLLPQSSRVLPLQVQQAPQNITGLNRHDSLLAANLAAAHAISPRARMGNPPHFAFVPAEVRADSFQEPLREWQPTGRMRGSLSGSAYSAALNQYLATSNQPGSVSPPASTNNVGARGR